MKITASKSANPASIPALHPMVSQRSGPWLMLISRSALFLIFQLSIALFLAFAGTTSASDAFQASARWWTFMAFLANFASIYLLMRVFNAEGTRYFEAIRFSRSTVKTDLIWFFLSSLIGMPIAAAPMNILGAAIFGDPMIPTYMLFRPLPTWAFILSFLFPLTIGFAELPTYFGYVMPRLAKQLNNGWLAWLIASVALAAQHMFLPLILDGGFILWRLLMYLPFAFFAGLMIKIRPTLLPYYMIVHALIDISAVTVYLMI
ncbi:MAG TPA: hypothetical protein VK897_05545 [Anaerolineales bacterium]|nr:hypothetical protein [Anaerolineales bacterium]